MTAGSVSMTSRYPCQHRVCLGVHSRFHQVFGSAGGRSDAPRRSASPAPDHGAGARRPPQQEHCRRPRHQPAYDREPSRGGHEEDRLALSFGADSLGARRRPRHRVAISPLTEKRRRDLSRGSPPPIGPIRSRARPGPAGSSAFSRTAGPDRPVEPVS